MVGEASLSVVNGVVEASLSVVNGVVSMVRTVELITGAIDVGDTVEAEAVLRVVKLVSKVEAVAVVEMAAVVVGVSGTLGVEVVRGESVASRLVMISAVDSDIAIEESDGRDVRAVEAIAEDGLLLAVVISMEVRK